MASKILVVGSSNTDLVVRTDHIPAPGETIMGDGFMMAAGGKGANQAVAVARLGGDVEFITCVGDDMFGKKSLENFGKENMSFGRTKTVAGAPSGIALICVDKCAENSIVVAPGTNSMLNPEDVPAEAIPEGGFVLMQLEIPMATIEAVAAKSKERGAKVVLNPAPAAPLSAALLDGLYLITPNRGECAMLTGIPTDTDEGLEAAMDKFIQMGVQNVVVTLGSAGSCWKNASGSGIVPALKVKAVDTTGAGDTFNGGLCVALAEGKSMDEALAFASKAAAISVTRAGAQPSIPQRSEIV